MYMEDLGIHTCSYIQRLFDGCYVNNVITAAPRTAPLFDQLNLNCSDSCDWVNCKRKYLIRNSLYKTHQDEEEWANSIKTVHFVHIVRGKNAKQGSN